MRIKLILFMIALLLAVAVIMRDKTTIKPGEFSKEIKHYSGFELSLSKTFTSSAILDGQQELVSKVRYYEDFINEKSKSDAALADLLNARKLNAGHVEGELLKAVDQKPGIGLSENVYLADGLLYQYSDNLTLGLKVENILGWLDSDEESDTSFFSTPNSSKESSVQFTLKYTF